MSMNGKYISLLAALSESAKRACLACTFILLAGCATEPAPTAFYSMPDSEPAALASIIGTRAVSGYIGDQTVYLAAVDGLPIENAKANYAYEVKATPGYKALTVVCAQDALVATSEITTELKAGHVYTLKAEKIPQDNVAQQSAQRDALYNIWIEDASTREAVGVKHMAKLNAIASNISSPENNVANSRIGDAAGEFVIRLIGAVLEAMINGALEPDHSHSTNSASAYNQSTSGVGSNPIKQPASSSLQTPRPGKKLPGDNGSQDQLKKH